MGITETQNMYLLIVADLSKRLDVVRNIDVANARGFSRSTVHAAMKNLENMGLVVYDNGNIALTEKGKEQAMELLDKHKLIVKGLTMLGIDEDVAEVNANKMEHVLTDEVYEILCNHIAMGEQVKNMMTMNTPKNHPTFNDQNKDK